MTKIKSKNVFFTAFLWGFAVLACMYVGSFIVDVVAGAIYYGALLVISVIFVRYIEKRLKEK